MYSTIDKFASSGLITRDEAEGARDAEASGINTHTIGYELEVLRSARSDIARAQDVLDDEELYQKCEGKLGPYGYTVGYDGMYELQSPVARHPHPLEIATRGLARFGWLPKKGTKGLVTSHVSIGTSLNLEHAWEDGLGEEVTRTLRAIEMFGGTTPNRLNYPLSMVDEFTERQMLSDYGWAQKGRYGVNIASSENMAYHYGWEGDNSRIELRTLGYYNPKQFGAMLNAVYYLTRGMFAFDERAFDIYDEYSLWLRDYCDANGLPDVKPVDNAYHPSVFREYLSPYVNHLASADLSEVRKKTAEAVRDLREEFGLNHIAFDDSHLADATSSMPIST